MENARRPQIENVRRKQLAWLNAILEVTGWKRQNLAERSGVSPATLTKFVNDPKNAAVLDHRTVERLASVSPLRPYETALLPAPRGFAEHEADPFGDNDQDENTEAAIAAVKAARNSVDAWILRSRALESAGFLPGDILMVDLNAVPEDGDVVCAQVYDLRGRAETVFRIYERPYLVAATLDRQHFKPIYVDERVGIRGVVINLIRARLSRLAS